MFVLLTVLSAAYLFHKLLKPGCGNCNIGLKEEDFDFDYAIMGAYLSEPMTTKDSEDGEGNKLKYGASSMQGWRVSQEDAHNCIAKFDENSSLFAVYDGHGGAEVAMYLSKHLPDFLKTCTAYKNGEFVKALEECYLKIDESIITPEVIKQIQQLAKDKNSNSEEATVDYDDENVGALYEEATMPLDKLVAKYQSGSTENKENDNGEVAGPSGAGSSKSMAAELAGSSKSTTAGAGSSSAASGSSTASASSPSAAESSKTDVKVNGNDSNDTTNAVKLEDQPEASQKSTSIISSQNETKTEEASKSSVLSNELVVEGKKIKLETPETDNNDKGDSEMPSSPSVNSISANESKPTSGLNGTSSVAHSESKDLTEEEGKKSQQNDNKENDENVQDENKCSTNGSDAEAGTDDKSKTSPEGSNSDSAAAFGGSSTPETPRRKKVIPEPVIMKDSKTAERRSPRKNQSTSPGESIDCSDSDDSDEDDAGYDMDVGESDSEMGEEEDVEEEEDSDEDDDYDEDEEEDEDERFLSDMQEPGYDSGSTAVVCFMKWETDGLSLWVANAGDSRCVVSRDGKAIDMSHDHKPELEEEAQRIVKAGGKVTEDGRVNGGLNLSRAIGDHSYKQTPNLSLQEQMISPLPSVEHLVLNPSTDKFLVLACDGIWNSMSSQEVVDFVAPRLEAKEPLSKICEALFDSCLAIDTCGDGTGCDNMTAIIVQVSDTPQIYSGSKRKLEEETANETTESSKRTRLEVNFD